MSQRLRIMLAEDDEVFLVTMVDALKGHDVSIAVDGDEVIKKMAAGSFDLLITDIMMPHKSGIGVIREIRQANPAIKIIAISSGANMGPKDILEWAKTAGADDYLEKPFYPAQLVEKVRIVTGIG